MLDISPQPMRLDSNAASTTPSREASQAVATFLLNEIGQVQSFDTEAERLFHCRASDAIGQTIFTLLPDFPRRLLLSVDPTECTATSRTLHLNASPKDGTRVPVEMTLTQLPMGEQLFWVGTLCDQSRQRRAEHNRQRNAEAYRQLFEQALIGLFQTSPEGYYLQANPELARIYGYSSPTALIAQHINVARDLYLLPSRREEFKRLLETNKCVTDFEAQIRRRDGSLLWISENARAVRDTDGTVLYYEGTVQDITARKRTETTLRESEQQIRTLFEATAVGITLVDMQGQILRSNPAFQQIMGYTEEELTGTAFARLTHPDDAPANIQCQWDLQEGLRDSYQVEKRFSCQDGCTIWANLSMSLVRDGEGAPHFAIAIVEDISDRHRTRQSILALNQHLERRVQRIAALHQIDLAIMASPNMESTLGLLLEQARTQLGMDAAAVLLRDPATDTLKYAAGSGLHHSLRDCAPQPMTFGPAGRAAREQCVVPMPNLAWKPEVFSDDPQMAAEGFVWYWAVPLIAKGEVKGVLELFGRHRIETDPEWQECLEVLAGQAAIAIDSATMFRDLQRTNHELAEAYEATIEGWGRALDLRDQETEGHSRRVTDLAERLARRLGFDEAEMVHVRRGSLLHDIGKMGVPDRILLKTEGLTPTEWHTMRKHPQDAYDMLSPITFLRPALAIPYGHHEKWDGTGYPRGLKGEEIPLAARLFAIVDVWDALRSDRPYRFAWSEAQTLDHVRRLSGTHFDPAVVEAFLEMMTGKRDISRLSASESDLLPLADLLPLHRAM
jgi:PAS domain S-box-containing protein/putative nucleotidyltransferase with HDIG domain